MIPAVGGNKGFVSPEEAKAVGLLVATKLKNKTSELPSVLIKELDSLNIAY